MKKLYFIFIASLFASTVTATKKTHAVKEIITREDMEASIKQLEKTGHPIVFEYYKDTFQIPLDSVVQEFGDKIDFYRMQISSQKSSYIALPEDPLLVLINTKGDTLQFYRIPEKTELIKIIRFFLDISTTQPITAEKAKEYKGN